MSASILLFSNSAVTDNIPKEFPRKKCPKNSFAAAIVFETAIPWNIKFVERPAGILFDILYNDNDGDGRRYCVELAPGIAEGKNNMIDSASLMMEYGHKLHVIEGPIENIKITTPSDYYVFRAIFEARENSQIFGL